MKMAFGPAGEARDVDLLAAFVALWRESRSGSLLFSRGAMASAGFELSGGEIVRVSSSEPRFETAAILVRAGKLDAAALERLAAPPGSDPALAALAAGILTKREWKWGEKIRAIEILADVLSWPDGRYAFDEGARPAGGEFVLSVPRLLLELFLRSRDRNLIEHQLGPVDLPLARSAAFDDEFATFGLTADAESVVRLIDGRASASEISERAPAEEFAVLKLLAALKTLGLLRADEALSEPDETIAAPLVEVPAEAAPLPDLDAWTRAIPNVAVEEPAAASPEEPSDLPLEQGAGLPEESLPLAREVPQPWREIEPESFDAPLEEPPPDGEADGADGADGADDGVAGQGPSPDQWDEVPSETVDRRLEFGGGNVPPEPPATNRRLTFAVAGVLLFLLAAVVATVLWRSRTVTRTAATRQGPVSAALSPAAVPTRALPAETPVPTNVPTSAAPATKAPTAQASPAPMSRVRRSSASPAAAATPVPAREAASAPAAEDRSVWLERARKDAKRLQGEKKTRYAIQLELVCETGSLVQAWKHDRPAGSIWLMATPHGDRQCFRVFWGRYGSIAQAKRAKAAVPGFFVTSTNHPAVVAVR